MSELEQISRYVFCLSMGFYLGVMLQRNTIRKQREVLQNFSDIAQYGSHTIAAMSRTISELAERSPQSVLDEVEEATKFDWMVVHGMAGPFMQEMARNYFNKQQKSEEEDG